MGGTHGNERAGIHAVQYIDEHPEEFRHGSVESVRILFGNPRAMQRNVRCIDRDLNRSFRYDYQAPLTEQEVEAFITGDYAWETKRALEIRRELEALAAPVDFMMDLHTTTSNMGNSLIISDDDVWTLVLCNRLARLIPGCRLIHDPVSRKDDTTSSSLGVNNITLEMGPFQQGVAEYHAIRAAVETVKAVIKTVDELNAKDDLTIPSLPDIQRYDRLPHKVDYPRDVHGVPTAVIHHEFMHRDFTVLQEGRPVFTTLDGRTIFFWRTGLLS
jgi:succinylglutamate desuccinylase